MNQTYISTFRCCYKLNNTDNQQEINNENNNSNLESQNNSDDPARINLNHSLSLTFRQSTSDLQLRQKATIWYHVCLVSLKDKILKSYCFNKLYGLFFVLFMLFSIIVTLFQFPQVILFPNDTPYYDNADLSQKNKNVIRGLSGSIVACIWFTMFYRILFMITSRLLRFFMFLVCSPCVIMLCIYECCCNPKRVQVNSESRGSRSQIVNDLNSQQQQRRIQQSQIVGIQSNNLYVLNNAHLQLHQEQQQPSIFAKERQLILTTINTLKSKYQSEDKLLSQQCSICLNDFKLLEKVVKLKCNEVHIFHDECLQGWVFLNFTCPLCRLPILQNHRNSEIINRLQSERNQFLAWQQSDDESNIAARLALQNMIQDQQDSEAIFDIALDVNANNSNLSNSHNNNNGDNAREQYQS
eukprot:403347875